MWAVGENCVAAMKFDFSGFYSSGGQDFAHLFFRWAPGPLIFFQGGLFDPKGDLFRSNHHFSDDFLVMFCYIHIILLY